VKPLPSILQRMQAKQEKAATKAVVYRDVYRRDDYRCRACWKPVVPGSTAEFKRAHPHHVQFRSRGGQDVADNIVTLCATESTRWPMSA
jgi:hypothetical protein